MAKRIGNKLPPRAFAALDGLALNDKIGPTYLLLTGDNDGTPRPCMLSAGEMLAVDSRTIRVALWPGTNTADNLRRGTNAVICFVDDQNVWYIRGKARPLPKIETTELERFEISIAALESDVHEGLPVICGIQFACEEKRRPGLLKQWQRNIDALRQA